MSDTERQHCKGCGYTKRDATIHGDHHLCKNAGNAPWELKADSHPVGIEAKMTNVKQAEAERVAGRIFQECLHHDEDGNLWMDRMKAVAILKAELAAANRDGYAEAEKDQRDSQRCSGYNEGHWSV